jgi:hypothetical protein
MKLQQAIPKALVLSGKGQRKIASIWQAEAAELPVRSAYSPTSTKQDYYNECL